MVTQHRFLLFVLLVFFTGCSKSYIQVFETKTINTELKDNYFVHETDSVLVTYSFWEDQGIMSFSVFNKLDKPFYIDWKKSSFIYNDNKLDYWIDKTETNSTAYYGGYYYNGPLIRTELTGFEGYSTSVSSTVKPERVTFIPPKSTYYRSQFYLIPDKNFKLNLSAQENEVPRNDLPKKKTKVYSEQFTENNSPLYFRNYLAVAFNENTESNFYIDNGFYLAAVKEMDVRHYRGKVVPAYQEKIIDHKDSPFNKPNSFFIPVSDHNSVDYRKRYAKNTGGKKSE